MSRRKELSLRSPEATSLARATAFNQHMFILLEAAGGAACVNPEMASPDFVKEEGTKSIHWIRCESCGEWEITKECFFLCWDCCQYKPKLRNKFSKNRGQKTDKRPAEDRRQKTAGKQKSAETTGNLSVVVSTWTYLSVVVSTWTYVLGMTLNSSVVVLSTTLNSCGAIEEMILWVLLQSALLQSAPLQSVLLHNWFSFLVVPDLLCS